MVEVLIVLVAIATFCNACEFYARIVVLAVRHVKKLPRLVELASKQEGQVRL